MSQNHNRKGWESANVQQLGIEVRKRPTLLHNPIYVDEAKARPVPRERAGNRPPLADRQIRDTRIDAPCLPEFAIASSVRSASPDICSPAVPTTTVRTSFLLFCTVRTNMRCIAAAEDRPCLADGNGAR
jgi:hypothetical protein